MKTIKVLTIVFRVTLLALFLLKNIFPPHNGSVYLIENVYPVYFNGVVEMIDEGRGFKIKLKNETSYYNLSGTCNDSACLIDNITWGDTLCKQANSNIILLKPKSNGKMSAWKLPAENDQSK